MIDYQDAKHGRLQCEAECYLTLWLARLTELFELLLLRNVEGGDINTVPHCIFKACLHAGGPGGEHRSQLTHHSISQANKQLLRKVGTY